jgi:hypothetical protein
VPAASESRCDAKSESDLNTGCESVWQHKLFAESLVRVHEVENPKAENYCFIFRIMIPPKVFLSLTMAWGLVYYSIDMTLYVTGNQTPRGEK